jgi:hypothetical protein
VFVEVVELGAVHGVTSTPSRGNSEYDTCPGSHEPHLIAANVIGTMP